MGSFYDFVDKLSPSGPVRSNKTLTMEEVGQNYGFMLYRTKIPSSVSGPVATISIPGLHDRAIIFVDQVCGMFSLFICWEMPQSIANLMLINYFFIPHLSIFYLLFVTFNLIHLFSLFRIVSIYYAALERLVKIHVHLQSKT